MSMKYLLALLLLCSCATDTLQSVNDRINAYEYQAETTDVWKTPQAFYADGGGDCEDFAIAKWHLLVNRTKALLYVYDTYTDTPHIVLLVDDRWILDNQERDVMEITSPFFMHRYRIIAKHYSTQRPT